MSTSVEVPEPDYEGIPRQQEEDGNFQRRGSRRGIKGSTITCHQLSYTVQVSPPGRKCACCATVPKEILRNVNGIFKPGMNAILGPTGGGKTSMLDVLAGRKDHAGINGTLLVDGCKIPKNFKCMTGYVVQDDVVMGTLTVRENLMFSANLRLPKSFSTKDKEERVEETLLELGLSKCADSKVGNEFIRGISGGERKRTNIGMELIISPSVLFLDEPTTGLDASTSNAVMLLMRGLSLRGRTIIFSIHQPRYSIFKVFDRLMLLAAGRTVYHGPSNKALQYFSDIGYECEQHNNPPDFFLDIINGDSSAVRHMEAQREKELIQENNKPGQDDGTAVHYDNQTGNGHAPNHYEMVGDPDKSLAEKFADQYELSQLYKDVKSELDGILKTFETNQKNGTGTELNPADYVTSFGTQLKYVCKRTITNIVRNPQTSVMQVMVSIVFAVVVGLIFLRLGDDYGAGTGIQNRIGVLFFVTVNQMFSNLSAVELFIKERVIFVHESTSGFYRISAYFFSKILCDVIPLRLVPLCFFTIITYFMVGLQEDPGKFFYYFLTLFLTTMCASSIGFAISASVRVFAVANLLISLVYVISMVFGGLLVNVGKMGAWLNWLQYLSIVRYSLNALSINELSDITLYVYNGSEKIMPGNTTVGPQYLHQQGIAYATGWDKWQNTMAQGIILIGMLTLAYIQLRRLVR